MFPSICEMSLYYGACWHENHIHLKLFVSLCACFSVVEVLHISVKQDHLSLHVHYGLVSSICEI